LSEEILKGDLSSVKDMLGGEAADKLKDRPILRGIVERLSGKIQEEAGVEKEVADKAAESSIPELVEEVSGKFASEKEEDAAFDIKSLIEGIAKGEGRDDIMDKAKDIIGGFADKLDDTPLGGMLGGLFGKKR